MIGALIGAGVSAAASLIGGNRAAKAAKSAARLQQKGIETGLAESGKLYDTAQGYLSPYVGQADESTTLMHDILGLNGPDAQQSALGKYQSSPIASLLGTAREEAVRRTAGQYAAGGLSRSGAHTEDLARRLSDMDVNAYTNWQNLGQNLYANESAQGFNASSAMSSNALNRGNTVLGARVGQATAGASGIVGAANAKNAGWQGAANSVGYLAGRMPNDFSFLPKGDVGTGSWAPVVSAA